MLTYAAFLVVLGFVWSQSTSAPTTAASAAGSTTASPFKFYYDTFYHRVVMVTDDACYFHQLTTGERYDAEDATKLKAIEAKILAAEKRLQEFGSETSDHYFYSYSYEIRKACQGMDTYMITYNA